MSNGRRRTYSPEISADIEAKLATLTSERDALREQLKEERLTIEDEARKRDEHFAEIAQLRTALRETREALKRLEDEYTYCCYDLDLGAWVCRDCGMARGQSHLVTCKAFGSVLARHAGLVEEVDRG